MDSLAILRSLTILEDRYRELREIGEKRFEAWEHETTELKQQLAAQAETLQQAHEVRDEQSAKLQSLEVELAALKVERDAADMVKAAAEQSAADLKQQLAAQAETLQQTQIAREEQAARVQDLEEEFAALKEDVDAAAKDKMTAEQSAADQKQQLAAQADSLQQTQTDLDEQAARVQGLEGEVAALTAERDGLIAGLRGLRHVARPAGQPL